MTKTKCMGRACHVDCQRGIFAVGQGKYNNLTKTHMFDGGGLMVFYIGHVDGFLTLLSFTFVGLGPTQNTHVEPKSLRPTAIPFCPNQTSENGWIFSIQSSVYISDTI